MHKSEAENGTARLNLSWRISIVWVAVTLIWLLIGALAQDGFGVEYNRSTHIMRAVLASTLTLPLIVWARRFLDRRPWAGLGLTGLRAGLRPLLVGMACWLIPAAIGLAVCLALGWTQITPLVSISEIIAVTLTLFALVFIYEALPEELIFRGYFYRNLADAMPLWMAVLGQALLFTAWGFANGGENSLDRTFLFFSFAVVVGIFRATTGSVWASIGFHLAFQTFAQLLGTVGGQFSVDGSQMLMVFAFGTLPFVLGLTLLNLFYKNSPNWRERETDFSSSLPNSPIAEAQ